MAGFRLRFSIFRTVALVHSQDARMRATMLILTGLLVIVTLFGGLYLRKQWKLNVKEKADKEYWSAKHDEARSLVLQTDQMITLKTGRKWGYEHVFYSDGTLRAQIETYIVQRDSSVPCLTPPCLKPRDLEPDKFLLPMVQKAIRQTFDTVEQFKREHPSDLAQFGWN